MWFNNTRPGENAKVSGQGVPSDEKEVFLKAIFSLTVIGLLGLLPPALAKPDAITAANATDKAVTAAGSAKPASVTSPVKPASSAAKSDNAGAKPSLQRADFRVTGASCVACLRRVAKRMREAPGVLKADVSIFRPYWSLVIYDKKKTTLKKVLDAAVEDKVKFAEVTDVSIAEMPVVLLPRTSMPGSDPAH